MKNISRRKFLGQASCAAVGSTTLYSSLANMILSSRLAGASSGNTSNYKALVCILLSGGNDSYNMLMPKGTSEYNDYQATRTDLAIPQADILQLNPLTSIGKTLGVHPSMPEVQNLFDNGNLAFVSNVGTLIEPVADANDFYSGNRNLPLGLYSHSDQVQQWQTSVPQSRASIGWGGKIADQLSNLNTNQAISMNISLSGRNVWQSGNSVLEYSISNTGNGVQGIEQYQTWRSNSGLIHQLREQAITDMATQMYSNVFKKTYGDLTTNAFDSIEVFQNALDAVTPFTTTFSNHYLSQNLQMVARTIAAKDDLGMCRQTFFIDFGGWDHHDGTLMYQEQMLADLSQAMNSFYSALQEVGMENDVTLFTISDFARTLTSNGNGSDHAWGGNTMVMGGAVNGREIYGTYPDLYLNSNPQMIHGRGNLIPTTSADEYFAELALWFGVPPSDLHLVLPNINNFYMPSSTNMPLGFLPTV